ncbi:nuclease A inhibitor family protein [Pedobacter sp. CFBP9032]|uniref:nuclease A inhibitor family protein n=1 Tax=Pedobacter sp. CFBP9032 TaxID=3096539 RepID=UPI002A6B5D0D|nr:nuclease A inhibitor family protein [Pedobacter sp. CFBP9032]MDY0905893.1 nuclease A inhibitor family protein [Pedobacter sp. CFBP9032]
MNNNILATITKLLLGVLYFTESESPFKVADWGKIPPAELLQKIATQYHAAPENLKQLDHVAFFHHLTSKVDAADVPMVENASKIEAVHAFLEQNLSNIQITRVEGASSIPVLITGYLPDGTCLALETFAVET